MGISYISESQLHPDLRKKLRYLQGAVVVSIVLDLVLIGMLAFFLFQRR